MLLVTAVRPHQCHQPGGAATTLAVAGMGFVALAVGKIESYLSAEAVASSQPVAAAQVGVGGGSGSRRR
jgi:hypothetical protein